jgi:hypothetical protein
MSDKERELALNLIEELRKETLESQRMRTQVIGFKITFVSTAIGIIYANKVPNELLIIPAFAAIFFDLLIVSYSISIRRIGLYCKDHLERQLREETEMRKGFCFWEDFFESKQMRPSLAILANLGITLLALAPAVDVLRKTYHPGIYLTLLIILFLMFLYDIAAFMVPGSITKDADNLLTRFFLGGKRESKFVLCVKNENYAGIELGKLYQIVTDSEATKDNYLRIIDESGEAQVYPTHYFARVKLPQSAETDLIRVL